MLALSPTHHLFSTTYGWPLDNIISQNPQQDCNDIISAEVFEANSYDHSSLVDFPTTYRGHQIQQADFVVPEKNSISISSSGGGAVNVNIAGDIPKNQVVANKKLNHNASERDRRKRVNDLYMFLRSLLPTISSGDQKKKESIPRTVSRALKYIPELEKEVETLLRKKETLLSYSRVIKKQQNDVKDAIVIRKSSSVVSSVRVLGDQKEAVIQVLVSSSSADDNKKGDINNGFSLWKVLEYLEDEDEDDDGGLILLNSTTFKSLQQQQGDQGMLLVVVNTLHLQVQEGDRKIEAERLKAKLCSYFYQCNNQIN